MIAHYILHCKFCGKEQYTAWHPLWKTKQICYKCRDKMYERHKIWMDKLLDNSEQWKEFKKYINDH